ncbi:unnamed protein product [Lactuca virosa]|uniref:Helitron helicase-like domain-containing protein n=1 Tax=Lactuca virosa TaxID=75947 RepID=A0AAU9P1A9_9ASTR|nr:unnamed protein product [Lactuca virosa]
MRATNSSSVTRSSSSNLSCRKLNKKRKIPNISHIPILDLTSDEDLRDQQIHQQLISDYLDHGDQTFVCTMGHAQLWTYEALKGNTSGKKTSYSMCCGNGKVELPELKEAPTNYQNLFRNVDPKGKNFMKNIRRFNSITQNEGCTSTSHSLDIEIISFLKVMLDSINELVKCYRMARDCFDENPHIDLKLRLIGRRKQDGRTYNLPTASEVAALIVGDIGDAIDNRDIIVTTKSGSLQRINELHPAYLGLQYPLLFPYGDDGYRVDIPHRDVDHSTNTKRRFCTMREFFAYRIQDRVNVFSLILNSRRLFQQFLVDAYTMIETERLYYIRNQFLADTTLNPEDRPDILSRLFKITLDSLIKDLKKKRLLGSVQAVVYTVEFQKRGLPHAHICLFMHSDYKLPTVEHIDRVISAEIPNKDDDPELYSLVSEFMMHGPCGSDNPKCPCMSENKCSKNFPKPFLENTSVDSNGYPIYRRRNDGSFIEKSGVKLDNRSVVLYHKTLLKRYQAHVNVEWCNQAASIKYLFKYINKGPDRATVEVSQNNNGGDNDDAPVDEIKDYYDCRYLSACEASWRIYGFDVHYRYPSVVRLPFHLPRK